MSPHSSDLVLVTGAAGFLGTHLVDRLLADGVRVRAAVRSPERGVELVSLFARLRPEAAGRLEIVVAELTGDEGWAAAVDGVASVHHIASPFPAPGASTEGIVDAARDGALRVLTAARDAGVRRVVLTSSFAAVGYSPKPSGGVYTEADWTGPGDDNSAYVRSKTIAEKAAWDFVRREGGALELAVVNPTGIFGPVLTPRLSSSIVLVKAMLDGAYPAVPPLRFGVVDVRDVADLHVRAMAHPAAAGERFLAVGDGTSSLFEIARILARHLGEDAARVPAVELTPDQVRAAAATDPAMRDAAAQLGRAPVISNHKARSVLGWVPRDTETTILDTGRSLLRLAPA